MRTFAHDRNTEVFRAVVTRKWIDSEGVERTYTEYAGPYTREGDARASATRITRWWSHRKDISLTVEIQRSELNWVTHQPALPLEQTQ